MLAGPICNLKFIDQTFTNYTPEEKDYKGSQWLKINFTSMSRKEILSNKIIAQIF